MLYINGLRSTCYQNKELLSYVNKMIQIIAIHQIRVNEMHDIHRLFNDIHLDTVNEKIILAAMLGIYFVQSSMEKRC